MTNLFPLPYWAPALKRVPIPLQALDEAFVHGDRFATAALPHDRAAETAAAPLSAGGEDGSRFAPG